MRVLAAIGFIAIVGALAAAVFFFGGFYSVAGTQREPAIVARAIAAMRDASIGRHATAVPPFALDDPATVQAGAKAFVAHGCHACHGAPGVEWEKFAEGMRPEPPDLKDAAAALEPRELFWVIANGLAMTGMPSFSLAGAGDREIWSIVAFLKRLPTVSEDEFRAWID